ncbi:MAG: response regulator transcription factor [Rhodoferax sp.]|nr:response regulator transcription factor [Pseudorhodobacter sp.]
MNILLADDQELVRESIAGFIRQMTGYRVRAVPDLPSALDAVSVNGRFDLVLLDYQMPGMSGLRGLSDMVAKQGDKPVAIISGNMPPTMVELVFKSGASGYLPKTMAANSLIEALRMILAGEKYAPSQLIMSAQSRQLSAALPTLSQRETVVLRHVCRGMTNIEIATALGVHETTVKVHVKSICVKVDARNRTQATMIAKDAGFH